MWAPGDSCGGEIGEGARVWKYCYPGLTKRACIQDSDLESVTLSREQVMRLLDWLRLHRLDKPEGWEG